MIGLFERLSRPLLRAIDPEDAHNLALRALRMMPQAGAPADPPQLAVRAFGLNFPNPLGIAAGFDKNAAVPDALLRLGFGFVEIGSVTPRAQGGNPRPRVFRLAADGGTINRLGFNNEGAAAVLSRDGVDVVAEILEPPGCAWRMEPVGSPPGQSDNSDFTKLCFSIDAVGREAIVVRFRLSTAPPEDLPPILAGSTAWSNP